MELKSILIIAVAIIFFGLMVWMFHGKSEKEVFKKLKLFPRWFKYLGLVLIVISATVPFSFDLNLLYDGKNYIGVQGANLGLFLICFARDKIEDEMTNLIRLKSFYRSVIFGFLYVIVMDTGSYIMGNKFNEMPAYQLVFYIMSFYIFSYYITKSKIRSDK